MPTTNKPVRVFFTGATGAMGVGAVRELVRAGHEVVGVSRSAESDEMLRRLGARPVPVNLFDADDVKRAMRGSQAVVHFATKIPEGLAALRKGSWATNDRLRTEGTRNLIEAAECGRRTTPHLRVAGAGLS